MINKKDYFQKYYKKHKEAILKKNRTWAKTGVGKASLSRHGRAKTKEKQEQKPDSYCKECNKLLDKYSKMIVSCSRLCLWKYHSRRNYLKIRNDPEKWEKFKKYYRDYSKRQRRKKNQ